MINSQNRDLFPTVIQSRPIIVNQKILGYNPTFDNNQYKLVPLSKILPISRGLLNFILTNLISIILEIVKRNLTAPNISIDEIKMIEDNYACGIPFIYSDQNKKSARECQEILVKQFSLLCKQLGLDENLNKCKTLEKFQDLLLLNINFDQDELNSILILNNLQIETQQLIYKNALTELNIVNAPRFILNNSNEDQIAIKISKQDEHYELREVEIIEKFNNEHLPFLYGYIRYLDILVLFLKKHDWTFSFLSLELYRKRQDIQQEQIEQIFLRLFQQMIKALKYTHSIGIIHRDIKPENIMFDLSQHIENYIEIMNISINCVLIDFDRSIIDWHQNSENRSYYEGIQFFRPPEGEKSKFYSSYDIWQLGFMWFVIQKIFFHKHAEEYKKIQEMQKEIQYFNKQIEDSIMNSQEEDQQGIIEQRNQKYIELIKQIDQKENFFPYNIKLQNIIKKMIDIDPQKRANLDEISDEVDQLIQ